TEGQVDIIVSPVGTGGTATGCARALKPRKPGLKVIGVEPTRSAVISGDPPGPHRIQGIGAGFVPEIFEADLMDEVLKVDDEAAEEMARQLCARDGVFVGISAGAGVAAARSIGMRPENAGKLIVVILPDTGERYLSHPGFESVIFNAEFQKPA
ncbi:MAG: pyridoxal-phosphate dependent enzyme, partial [Chloroflexota bacterium]|nr:pyridoxal-phosphate dependent enzyme [Chloroflexota bacterium]